MTREEELESIIRDLVLVGNALVESEWGSGQPPSEEHRARLRALIGDLPIGTGWDEMVRRAEAALRRPT